MAGPGDLHAFAVAYLDACVEALDTIPNFPETSALLGAPDRRFVSPGIPVWDCCEQLAVHVPLMNEADTTPGGLDAGKRTNRGYVNSITFLATITRCIPTMDDNGNPPTAAALEAKAAQIDADGWALWNHLHNLKASAQLLTLCDEMFFDGILAAVPSGGCAGWTVTVRAAIGGYEELLGS
jgi:hypothetical protein